jgi:hypothetical protein
MIFVKITQSKVMHQNLWHTVITLLIPQKVRELLDYLNDYQLLNKNSDQQGHLVSFKRTIYAYNCLGNVGRQQNFFTYQSSILMWILSPINYNYNICIINFALYSRYVTSQTFNFRVFLGFPSSVLYRIFIDIIQLVIFRCVWLVAKIAF